MHPKLALIGYQVNPVDRFRCRLRSFPEVRLEETETTESAWDLYCRTHKGQGRRLRGGMACKSRRSRKLPVKGKYKEMNRVMGIRRARGCDKRSSGGAAPGGGHLQESW
jgi:hypothetical protein